MIAPNSTIILLKTPIELDENNQLTFSNRTTQYNYFHGLTKRVLDEATFQRKDGVIRFETNEVDFTFDDVIEFNYCMYQNTNYGDRWFYAFITKHNYINDGLCDIEIKTDVFQTYYFDTTFRASFVEREHLAKSDDIIGANTQPENLETGDYIIDSKYYSNFGGSNLVMASTIDVGSGNNFTGIIRDGLFSGLNYTLFKTPNDLVQCLHQIDRWGKGESVYSIFYALNSLTDYHSVSWTTHTGDFTYDYAGLNNNLDTAKFIKNITVEGLTSIGNFTPHNKKLLTFPYCFLQVTNMVGNNAIYHFEDFTNHQQISFDIWGVLCQGNSVIAVPMNYRNGSWDTSITLGKLPTCSWTTDTYVNWLTQNAVNIPLSIAGSILSSISGAKSNNATQITSGLLGVAQTLGNVYEHSLIPPQANGNTNSGDVMFAYNNNMEFYFNRKRIKEEYARVIDNFFDMYGYKTNRVKIPNTNNRSNWNYIKTINANIIGDIPQEDMQELKNIFNKGITLWHNPSTFLDYSQSNN